MYLAAEKEHDYNLFASILEAGFKSGVPTTEHVKKVGPWWEFW
jgi:hypothetical protein